MAARRIRWAAGGQGPRRGSSVYLRLRTERHRTSALPLPNVPRRNPTMNGRAPHERLLRTRLAALARMLPAARRGDVNGVHKARVATRRLRETLPIVLAEVPARKS